MKFTDWLSGVGFRFVHGNNLVYNTCWEDPRLDRQALELGPDDTIVVITSAGCNALDYALQAPKGIHAVDMNPRQNALLDLKIAGIKTLDFDTFFQFFGQGKCKECVEVYQAKMRPALSLPSQKFWDRRIKWFKSRRRSFYFHGTAGSLAWLVNFYIDYIARVRGSINDLLAAKTLEEQERIYTEKLHQAFWKRFMRWIMDRDTTLSLLGVPRPQRRQVESTYFGSIAKFIEDRIETVFTKLPFHENYFWRVYLTGHYTHESCPEYLKRENFEKLKGGLVDRVSTHTSSLLDFLERYPGTISRFVLLDHMDWLSTHLQPVLHRQWQAIIDRSAPHTRYLWRSGGMHVDFIDPIEVNVNGQKKKLGELLTYNTDLSSRLHQRDRVHTYGSFYIADWKK